MYFAAGNEELLSWLRYAKLKKMENNKKYFKDNMPIYNTTVITFILFIAFFCGKIIDIPYGTTRGAIICGIGALVILIIAFIISVGFGIIAKKIGNK